MIRMSAALSSFFRRRVRCAGEVGRYLVGGLDVELDFSTREGADSGRDESAGRFAREELPWSVDQTAPAPDGCLERAERHLGDVDGV
jgi:hypothetical protein